ncbi:MAG: bifunctional diaminohydroxyphosphoribosylaminopyrimidine deaminase/5-amino-6-(5-phosphoribosylamino)uracil reductase RibD [Acidobacteriota bacterium]
MSDIEALMLRALGLAEAGRYGASPNPLVGAIVLDPRDAVVGEGAHQVCGGPHAEVIALAAAGPAARGGTLVVTLEPCAHFGRTPPCVDAIIAAGVARVVAGPRDPNPAVNGQGYAALRAAGIEVTEGLQEEACERLNRRFFQTRRTGLPYVTLKMALSLDGKIAARGGISRWITCEESRRAGYALREEYDAILVGAGTLLADNPRLLRHLGLNPNPHLRRVVLDSTLRTPAGAALLEQLAEDVVIVCREPASPERRRELEAAGATVLEVGDDGRGRCDLRQTLRWLTAHEVTSVLVEGGGEVHWSFLRENLAQRVHAFIAPMVIGGREAVPAVAGIGFPSPQDAVRLRFEQVERIAGDLLVIGEVLGV